MRSEAEIKEMLKQVDSCVTDDTDSSDPESITSITLQWVLDETRPDYIVTENLPE